MRAFVDHNVRSRRFFVQTKSVRKTGNQDNRKIRLQRPDAANQLDAVHLGHLEIGDHQVEFSFGKSLHGLFPVHRGSDEKALFFEKGLANKQAILVVVYEQQMGRYPRLHHRCMSHGTERE